MCCLAHRFLFILLGPRAKVKAYHEVGRAMATLLTDEVSLVQHPQVGWTQDEAQAEDSRAPLLCRLQAEDGASWWPPLPKIRKQRTGGAVCGMWVPLLH